MKEIAMLSHPRPTPLWARTKDTLLLLLVAALAAGPALAAEEAHRLVVPLSNTSKPADLDVGLVLGSIRVAAGTAGEVVIEAQRDDGDDDDDDDDGPVSGKAK